MNTQKIIDAVKKYQMDVEIADGKVLNVLYDRGRELRTNVLEAGKNAGLSSENENMRKELLRYCEILDQKLEIVEKKIKSD